MEELHLHFNLPSIRHRVWCCSGIAWCLLLVPFREGRRLNSNLEIEAVFFCSISPLSLILHHAHSLSRFVFRPLLCNFIPCLFTITFSSRIFFFLSLSSFPPPSHHTHTLLISRTANAQISLVMPCAVRVCSKGFQRSWNYDPRLSSSS